MDHESSGELLHLVINLHAGHDQHACFLQIDSVELTLQPSQLIHELHQKRLLQMLGSQRNWREIDGQRVSPTL